MDQAMDMENVNEFNLSKEEVEEFLVNKTR